MLEFKIRILWLKNKLGIGVDQIYGQRCIHLTSYYFWPQNDAWELIRLEINSKIWISKVDKISILNNITKILNKWNRKTGDSKLEEFDNDNKEMNLVGIQ